VTATMADDAPAATAAIARLLARHGVAFTLHRHEPARTSAEMARLSFPRERWLKTVAFRRQRSGEGWVLAALRHDAAIDYRALADAVGAARRDLTLAPPEAVMDAFGWEAGGVCPLPLAPGVAVVFDAAWPPEATVYCGAGRSDHTLEIRLADLIAVGDGRVRSIAKAQ
jgi:prolyl-tRNA editing enzyme YbaK/EbsC (Cys-tRNA(Pro) deacylase)